MTARFNLGESILELFLRPIFMCFEKQMQCFIKALDSCACKAIFGHWSCHAKNRFRRHMHIKPTKTKTCMYTVGA